MYVILFMYIIIKRTIYLNQFLVQIILMINNV
jgi:hypothetical protein